MKHYLLIDDNDGKQLDHVWATLEQAEYHFFTKQGWVIGSITHCNSGSVHFSL